MFPARSPASRRTVAPAPDHEKRGPVIVRRGSFLFFLMAGDEPPPAHRSNETSRMKQAPDLHAIDARPAAVRAVPGPWPSCAVKGRGPGAAAAPSVGKGGKESGFRSGGIHLRSIEQFGQDRRYAKDQRGRAVMHA
jgi:hypothetical protein